MTTQHHPPARDPRRHCRRLLGSAFAAGLASLLALSAAQAASRVVLLRAPGDDALMREGTTLLVAELRAVGFEVVHAERDPSRDIRADISETSSRLQPVATFAILPAPGGAAVELWLEDRITGKLVIRRIDIGRSHAAAADLALKAVELLRGSLLEITVARRADAAAPPPPPSDVARFVAKAPLIPRAYFNQGPGVAAGAGVMEDGPLDPGYAAAFRLWWGGRRGLAGRLTVLAPSLAREARALEGVATIRQELVVLEALYAFRPGSRLQPVASAGVGGFHVGAQGRGVSSLFGGANQSGLGAAAAAGGGVAARLGDRVALVLEAGVLLLAPRMRIAIASREAASVGGISLLATLNLAAAL
jgi:hypothetical protein